MQIKPKFSAARAGYGKDLMGALPIVASTYASRYGVPIRLGRLAQTDGRTIWLPMVDISNNANADIRSLLFGWLAHEAAHVRWTDFAVTQTIANKVTFSLTNSLEDVRVERLMIQELPGTEDTLRAKANFGMSKRLENGMPDGSSQAAVLTEFVLYKAYERHYSTDHIDQLLNLITPVAESVFPEGFFVRFDALMDTYFDQMKSTRDALRLAKALLTALEEELEKAPPPAQPPSNPQPNDEESEGEGDGEGESSNATDETEDDSDDSGEGSEAGDEGESDDSDSAGANGHDDSESDEDADDSADDSGASQGGEDSQETDEDSTQNPGQSDPGDNAGKQQFQELIDEVDLPEDLTAAVEALLNEQAQDEETEMDPSLMGMSVEVEDQVTEEKYGSHMLDVETLDQGIEASYLLRAQIVSLLQAQARERRTYSDRGKRIDPRRIARALAGDPNFYRQVVDGKRIDTSVHVLLDTSGSMSSIQTVANAAAVSLAIAIGEIQRADIAVTAFGYGQKDVAPMLLRGQAVRHYLPSFALRSYGTTPMAEGMLYAAQELATNSRRRRKVMIVVTDGAPDNGGAVHYVNSLCEAGEIEVYAIGICSPLVENYFENWSVIHSVDDLQGSLFALARQFLDVA